MAGMGPLPNPNSRRSRRGGAGAGFTRLPRSGRAGDPPPLPPRPAKGRQWLQETRIAWAAWWASPQATQWLPAYLPTIYRMARLLDAVLREPQKDLLAELRHLEDRFGLSPMALLRNRWLLDDATHDNSRAATVVRLRPVETT